MASSEIARKILDVLRREQAPSGFHIREQWLADALGVSRSPVRNALRQLASLEVVRAEQSRGYFLAAAPGTPAFDTVALPPSRSEQVYLRIASERFANLLGDQVSVGDLVRRYDVSRAVILKALGRMQQEGLVEKSPGHVWRFSAALNDEPSYQESYRFRLLIEPAALREPTFSLPRERLRQLRDAHAQVLAGGEPPSIAALFDLDAEFHDCLAEHCGNRFLAQAIRQQTRLRRLSEYQKYAAPDRMLASLRDHLAILDAIAEGAVARAAEGMADHIRRTEANRPDFRKVRVLAHRRLTRR